MVFNYPHGDGTGSQSAFTNSNVVGSGYAGGPYTKKKTPSHKNFSTNNYGDSEANDKNLDADINNTSHHFSNNLNNKTPNDGSNKNKNSNTNVNNIPKWPEDNDLEGDNPQADKGWVDTITKMNTWQSTNDTVNTFFTGGATKLNSNNWETQKLFTAGNDILKELGLDNNKKNMQIAMNILQGGKRIWGRTKRALEGTNKEQYDKIMDIVGKDADGNTKSWDTWGTNLRGDATWGGTPISQEDYQDKMAVFSGNWDAGSPLYKYQQVLKDGWQSANPNYKMSGSNKLGAALLTAMLPMAPKISTMIIGVKGFETYKGNLEKPKTAGEVLLNPIGALIPDGWIADKKVGIKKLKINGKEISVNDKTVNRNDGDGGIFSKYDLMEDDLGNDSGTNSSSPYHSTSYNIEDIVDDIEDTEEDAGESENTLTADDNPAWWNFKLFETIFSPLTALKYNQGDIVQTQDNDMAAKEIVNNIASLAVNDEQAKKVLKNLVEENEQIANVVNKYTEIKNKITKVLGPLEISADVDDLSVQAKTSSGFITEVDLDDKELSVQKQMGDLDLTASYNPEKKSGFLGLQKEF